MSVLYIVALLPSLLWVVPSRATGSAAEGPLIEPWNDGAVRVRMGVPSQPINFHAPGALSTTSPQPNSHPPLSVTYRAADQSFVVSSTALEDSNNALFSVKYAFTAQRGLTLNLTGLLRSDCVFGYGEHQLSPPGHRLLLNQRQFNNFDCLVYGKSHGGAVCIPYITVFRAGRQLFGFLFHSPSYGVASFPMDPQQQDGMISFVAQEVFNLDFLITTGLQAYTEAVGRAPPLPPQVMGYWHSRNRYKTQAEIIAVARRFAQLHIPVDVLVIDYHHWVHMGDWSFNPVDWPDPAAMVRTVKELGIGEIMVSVWPFSANDSRTLPAILQDDLWVGPRWWNDNNCDTDCVLYDPTVQAAREFVFSNLKSGYLRYNISIYWLDAAEPEISTSDATAAALSNVWNHTWPAAAAGMAFPLYHTQTIYDGLRREGFLDGQIISLARSAWVGSWRHGAALWSGDSTSQWTTLATSIATGLGVQLSGVAWWTTDIGGYAGGDPSNPAFCELLARWFQFGLTCPLFRQHGARETEPWKLVSHEAYVAVLAAIQLRKQFLPYVAEVSRNVSVYGTPINRPLFWDFPDDAQVMQPSIMEAEYMWGDKYLVAPVTAPNATSWPVYLPRGSSWRHHFTGQIFGGGQWINVSTTPLSYFPLLERL